MFSNIINTFKSGNGIIKILEQQALKEGASEEDSDRKNVTNSPSSAGGCIRANFYQRLGEEKGVISPRLRRIFDNGHAVHERIQSLAKRSGVLAMDEVPLFHKELEIQGHTDGIVFLKGGRVEAQVLEIKSINGRGFTLLKDAREDHKAQAQVYIYCLESHRKHLRETYPTKEEFNNSDEERSKVYRELHKHLRDGEKFSREQKIQFKVDQHLMADDILYKLKKPITQTVILYENKDTQEFKEFIVDYDEEFMEGNILKRFRMANKHWEKKIIPRRECANKNQGKWCPYLDTCFPS